MLDTFFGLPIHPLIVHATVVIVPTAAAAVLLAALWPRFRAWAGWGPLALSVVAVVLTPLSTSSGENLRRRIGGGGPLVEEHSELAGFLLWWVIPLAVLAAALYWAYTFRGGQPERTKAPVIRIVLTVVSAVVAVGTLVQVVLIGHSGAKAVWSEDGAAVSPVSTSYVGR